MGKWAHLRAPAKGREEAFKLANMYVNNAGFNSFQKLALQMFKEGENAFNTFVRPQGYTHRM